MSVAFNHSGWSKVSTGVSWLSALDWLSTNFKVEYMHDMLVGSKSMTGSIVTFDLPDYSPTEFLAMKPDQLGLLVSRKNDVCHKVSI